MTENSKWISEDVDSGAEITVWLPELAPETPTEESEESRSGVKHFGPGDMNDPTLVNHGRSSGGCTPRSPSILCCSQKRSVVNTEPHTMHFFGTSLLSFSRPVASSFPLLPFSSSSLHLLSFCYQDGSNGLWLYKA